MHTKSLGHLVKGQHLFVAETIKARFKSIGGADLGDNGDSELKPIGGCVGFELGDDVCVVPCPGDVTTVLVSDEGLPLVLD